MTTKIENVCNFDYRGFCKFRSECSKHHFKEICNDKKCSNNICPKRHPRFCYYFINFNNCKFGNNCRYLHGTINSDKTVINDMNENVEELKNIKTENELLKNKLEKKVEIIKEKDDLMEKQTVEITELKELLKEAKEIVENVIKENNIKFDKYEKAMEENHNEKINIIIKQYKLDKKIEDETENVEDTESEEYKCKNCDYKTILRNNMNNHKCKKAKKRKM